MQALSLPASAGLHWVRDGFALFRKQPFPIMTLVLAFFFGTFLLLAIPVIGLPVALTLIPGLSVGFMYAARDIEQGVIVIPTRLVAAFRQDREVARRLFGLGIAYAITMGLAQFLVAVIDDGELARAIGEGDLVNPDVPLSSSVQLTMLAAVLLQIAVTVVYWFAPVLVAWHGVTPAKSVFFSVVAAWRSRGAFIVFGVAMLALTLLTQASVAIVLGVLGVPVQYQVFIVMPLTVAQIAVFYCAAYASYLDAFGLRELGPPRVDTAA